MSKKGHLKHLYRKFLEGTHTPEEFETLIGLVKGLKDPDEKSRLTHSIWKTVQAREGAQPPVQRKRPVKKPQQPPARATQRGKKNAGPYRVAAILVATLAVAFLIYRYQRPPAQAVTVLKATAPGQKATFTLPDGTHIKLNSGSRLTYPQPFEGTVRALNLEGEAYFEVARDVRRPMVVRSGGITTTVLGTAFNIKAYPADSAVQVAVASGEVAVATTTGDVDGGAPQAYRLVANTVATYTASDKQLRTGARDVSGLVAWKDGVLRFEGENLVAVAAALERWYGVKVTLENPQIGRCRITAEFRGESLQDVLKVLKVTIGTGYALTPEGAVISGKGCPQE